MDLLELEEEWGLELGVEALVWVLDLGVSVLVKGKEMVSVLAPAEVLGCRNRHCLCKL